MLQDLSIDEEVPKRRLSMFNRTKTDGVVANDTRNHGFEEYYEKLKAESNSWKQILNETEQKNIALKKKVKSKLVEKYNLETVDDEVKDVVLNQPDYCTFAEKVNDLCSLAAIIAVEKKIIEEIIDKKIQSLENKTDLELLELYNAEE